MWWGRAPWPWRAGCRARGGARPAGRPPAGALAPPKGHRIAERRFAAQTRLASTSRTSAPRGSRNETLWKVSLRVRSVRLDAGELDHLAPLLRFVGYELSKVGRRAWKGGGAQLGKPRLHLGIGEGRIDLFVELVDNLGRRVFRRADAGPEARLVARHEFGNRRDVRQHRRACRGGHRQRSKLAAPDVFDR